MRAVTGTRVSRWGRPRAWLAAATAGVRRRRGATGFVAGMAVGAVLTLLLATMLPSLTEPEDRPDAGELIILSGTDDSIGGQRAQLIDQWNALGGGRPKAKIIAVAGGANAARSAMVSDAQHGIHGADIYNLDVTMMAEFVEFEYLRPLADAELDLNGFLENPMGTCWRNGKLWALPFHTDAGLLYYRKDLLRTATEPSREPVPPTSWPGINTSVEKVFAGQLTTTTAATAPARSALIAGYAGQFADYEGLSVNAFEAIWAAGGEVVDKSGKVVIDTPAAQEGVSRLVRELRPGNPQIILADSLNFNEGETTQAFRDGRVVFMRNWPVAYRNLVGEASLDWIGVTRVPNQSVLGGQNLAVAARSDQPRAAQELISFLTSPRSQQILFERGGLVPTQEIVYSDHDRKIREDYPYMEILLEAIRQAKLRPDTPYYELFSRVFRQGIRYALANDGRLPDGFAADLTDALRGVRR